MRLVHLEKLRRLKGWTQEEAANKAGVARSTYANWENGKREPDFETSEKLTQLFEVSLDYLLGKSKFINAELLAEEYTALKSQDTTNVLEGENMSLGKRLKAERNKKGWSQIVVAQKLGITNTVLSNYERDYRDPDTETLTKLAELYETSTDYLLRGLTNSTFDGNIQETPSKSTERDYHLYDTNGVQVIARSNKNLSPAAYKKMQELAKKAAELFAEDED